MTGPRYRALLIGNSHYPDDPDNLPDLKGPINDVSGLGRVLSGNLTSLFSPTDITLLTDRPSYEISAELEELLTGATRDDVLLIYYSGHGITADNGSLLLCARNTRTDRKLTTTISAETITRMTDQSAAAITVIVLDCCYAGAFKGGDVASELAGRGRYVLAATRSSDRAADAEHSTGFSRFTAYLLRGLEGAAARPGAQYVTVSDLYHYLRRRMAEDGPLVPQRRFDGDGDPALARAGLQYPRERTPPDPPGRAGTQPAVAASGGTPWPRWRRRLNVVTVAAIAMTALAGAAIAVAGLPGRSADHRAQPGAGPSAIAPASLGAGAILPSSNTLPSIGPASAASAQHSKRQATLAPTLTAPVRPSPTISMTMQPTGSFSSPLDGAKVKSCAYFSGSAHLAKGQSLILAMRSLDNGDNQRYVQQVFGWDKPDELSSWRGAQYFNGDPGQRYSIELMAVDLEASRAAKDYDAREAADALVPIATSLAVREVDREAGTVSNDCPGP
ncbi:caspase family protein [Actinoplanes sp. NPDC051513]|uniref:caspase family protein n=1 Tax=Actinoplanes sp. NPDC051513 TaxID=3363908 RepID=UPI00379C13DF